MKHHPTVSKADILTTGEIARLCRVAPRTAAKWIDKGLLPGYRLPLCQDRRVFLADLIKFCQDSKIPLPPDIASRAASMVVVCSDQESLRESLEGELGSSTVWARNLFHLGWQFERYNPDVLVVDLSSVGSTDGLAAIRQAHAMNNSLAVALILGEDQTLTKIPNYAIGSYQKPFNVKLLADAIILWRYRCSQVPSMVPVETPGDDHAA